MPFLKEIVYKDTIISLWEIQENEILEPFLTASSLKRVANMKHPRGFLATRKLLEHYGYSDVDLSYDTHGKPLLRKGNHISISHSGSYAAISIGPSEVGIDIEKISPKLTRVAPYFIKNNLPSDLQMLAVNWCVKEAIYKISHSRTLSFKEHLHIKDFCTESFTGLAHSTFPDWEKEFHFQVYKLKDYILVASSKR